MANANIFESGYDQGSQIMANKFAHKQAMSDQEFQEKHDEIQGMIDNLQSRLATVPKDSPDYLKAQDDLAQALQQRDQHWKSLNHPNVVLELGKKLGRDLKFKKQAPPPAVAPPVYGQPTMDVDGQKVATGPAYRVQGPQTPAQVRAQAEALRLSTAAPLSPEEKAQQDARADAAGNLVAFQSKLKLYDQQNPHATSPDATPDEKQARQEYIDTLLQGTTKEPVDVWTPVKGAAPEKLPDGSYRELQMNKKGEYRYQQMPEGYTPPPPAAKKLTNIDEERESYRKDHNIPSGQPLTFAQEKDFVKQLALARNPFGPERIEIAKEGLGLRQQEANVKDTMSLLKGYTPLERVIQGSDEADQDIANPTGSGDVALTLAFFDAIKTQGVRFTKQEQDFIVHSRSFMDNVQAAFDKGYEGTVFGPQGSAQRAQIAAIVKKAADVAKSQKNALTAGVGSFNPKAAEAANGTDGTKPKHSLKKAMALSFNKGKTEAQVRADLEAHGYEVIP